MRVGAFELGGSHVSVGIVNGENGRLERAERAELGHAWSQERLRETLVAAARSLRGVACVGAAVPGPFDYEQGICTIRGVDKLDALYGVDMRALLASAADVTPERVCFLNDAQAFGLGETAKGAARGEPRVIALTLGTGLGSSFLVDGEIVTAGAGIPEGGELYAVPFRGGRVEDLLSGRGLAARCGGLSAVEIAARADAGDDAAVDAFASFGDDLAEFLEPWVAAFRPTRMVVGGSIARSWHLFGFRLDPRAVVAQHPSTAALFGATSYARRWLGD